MSFNNQGAQNFGYGPNANTNQNVPNQSGGNPYQTYGYGNSGAGNATGQNFNPQVRFNTQANNDPYGNKQAFSANNNQFPVNNNHPNTYNQNPYNQPYQKYPDQGMPVLSNLFQPSGGFNQASNQMSNNNNQKQKQTQNGLNVWADLAKMINWDDLLKTKNVSKKQSDTSWVTYQQKSWLQPQPSCNIQIQSKRKFEFPNPYIKYKIIPGVDQTMALDVTSKDQPEKGYVKGSLIIWNYHGGPNQQFYIHRFPKGGNNNENDEFMLINAATGFVVSAFQLTTEAQKKTNGTCVCPKMKDSASQRWKLRRIKENSDIFTIQSVGSGNVMDCENGSRSNGTNVIEWKSNDQKNQKWKILPA